MTSHPAPRLDRNEQHFSIAGPRAGMSLFLRHLAASAAPLRRTVLYVHGATFPSALSIAHRFSDGSWRDALCAAGFDVWGLDFYGFGHSDRYPEMAVEPTRHAPLCAAADASEQLKAAVEFVLSHQKRESLSLISHSWGSMPAGLFISGHVKQVDRWVLFGPIARRPPRRYETPPVFPAWRLVSVDDQWRRFIEDVPGDEPAVLSRVEFDVWAEAYLHSDPQSRTRTPPSVNTPAGPISEILRAWHGELAYDPGQVTIPVAIIRGAWDGLIPDEDARWLFDAFAHSPQKRDIKISHATHLMHLEKMRRALWRESINFLLDHDLAPSP